MRSSALAVACTLAIALSASGATIHVEVQRGPHDRPLELRLGVLLDDREPDWIASHTLPRAATEATFTAVPAGFYVVQAIGTSPLERLTRKVGVGADDVRRVSIEIPRRRLEAKFLLGGKPLGPVHLMFLTEEGWTMFGEAGSDGTLDAPFWTSGNFILRMRDGKLPASVPDSSTTRISPCLPLTDRLFALDFFLADAMCFVPVWFRLADGNHRRAGAAIRHAESGGCGLRALCFTR